MCPSAPVLSSPHVEVDLSCPCSQLTAQHLLRGLLGVGAVIGTLGKG